MYNTRKISESEKFIMIWATSFSSWDFRNQYTKRDVQRDSIIFCYMVFDFASFVRFASQEFIANEGGGEAPLEGAIPDMTSSTELVTGVFWAKYYLFVFQQVLDWHLGYFLCLL